MTVSYALAVSSASTFSFFKLLKIWKGSIWKHVWKELVLWCLLYYIVTVIIHLLLPTSFKRNVAKEFEVLSDGLSYFDTKFMLGFFVSCVVDRWRKILDNIAFIDTTAISISSLIRGKDSNVRLARRSIIRYLVLSQILVFRDLSMRVRRRFPTMKSLIDSGFLFENELREFDAIELKYTKYWAPINWANAIVWRTFKQGYIDAPVSVNNIFNSIKEYRKCHENLCKLDWVPIPIAYPQVVFLSVRIYFLVAIFARQFVPEETEQIRVFKYFPIMTMFQFLFYMGWMKVAEALLNPLGEDDDDFEGNWVIDRNISTGMRIVDESHDDCPDLNIDRFSDPKFGPMYPIGNFNIGALQGSAADVIIEEKGELSRMVSIDAEAKEKKEDNTSGLRHRFSKMGNKLILKKSLSNQKEEDTSEESGRKGSSTPNRNKSELPKVTEESGKIDILDMLADVQSTTEITNNKKHETRLDGFGLT